MPLDVYLEASMKESCCLGEACKMKSKVKMFEMPLRFHSLRWTRFGIIIFIKKGVHYAYFQMIESAI